MRKIKKIDDGFKEVYRKCYSNYSDKNLVNRLKKSEKFIVNLNDRYEREVRKNMIHKITKEESIPPKLKSDEMSKLYTDKLVKKGQPGRVFYEKIKMSAKNGECPFCQHRVVATLDHYLPKKKYPAFAVSPINLVPACRDCNIIKGEYEPICSQEELIHPYFDDIENIPWLAAKLRKIDMDVVVTYYVNENTVDEDNLFQRIKRHFEVLELNKLYSSNGARELMVLRRKIDRLYDSYKGDIEVIKSMLEEELSIHEEINLNWWKTVLYRAAYQSISSDENVLIDKSQELVLI